MAWLQVEPKFILLNLDFVLIFMVNVGKDTIPYMDAMGSLLVKGITVMTMRSNTENN